MTFCFDFDGVIHSGFKGYRDGSIYGEIDHELLREIKSLMRGGCFVVICSCRPAGQIVEFMNRPENSEGLKFELFEPTDDIFWKKKKVIGVSNRKIPASVYIDDKALRWNPESSDIGRRKLRIYARYLKRINKERGVK